MKKFSPKLIPSFTLILIIILHMQGLSQHENEIQAIENGITPSILIKGQPIDKMSLEDKMKMHNVVNLSVAVIKDGKIRWAKGYGSADGGDRRVDESTIFQAASISKPIAAAGIHKLVQDGKLDLDVDVNDYLTSWKVPPSRFVKETNVTLRGLMTHTAGTTVHGFPGYKSSDTFPSDIEQYRSMFPQLQVDDNALVVHDGKYILVYQTVKAPYVNRVKNQVGMAIAESPEGPFKKLPG